VDQPTATSVGFDLGGSTLNSKKSCLIPIDTFRFLIGLVAVGICTVVVVGLGGTPVFVKEGTRVCTLVGVEETAMTTVGVRDCIVWSIVGNQREFAKIAHINTITTTETKRTQRLILRLKISMVFAP